jgi:predicted peptidase
MKRVPFCQNSDSFLNSDGNFPLAGFDSGWYADMSLPPGASPMLRRMLTLFTLALFGLPLVAAEKTGFVDKVYKNADGHESKYVVFVPHSYDGTKPVPVILFLHGSGETKGDKSGKMPVEVGLGPAIKKREKTFPFLVVIPQSEKRTWKADTEDGKRAIAMLDETMKDYKVDPKRQYLTGLSMGGFGTWHAAFTHADRWAAFVPVCGGGDPRGAEKLKDLPCWCFHGDKDTAVKVELSRTMIEALKKAGGDPKYTEYAGVGHNSWDKAYGTDELYEWMLKQVKK